MLGLAFPLRPPPPSRSLVPLGFVAVPLAQRDQISVLTLPMLGEQRFGGAERPRIYRSYATESLGLGGTGPSPSQRMTEAAAV